MNHRHIITPAGRSAVAAGDEESRKRLFDARKLVEAAMARQAARIVDEAHLARLKDALEANRRAIGDHRLFMQTDIEFHRIFFQISGNPIFGSIHAVVVDWLMKCWGEIERDEVTEQLAFQGHAKVSDAVAHGDPDAAEQAMNQHLSASWPIWARQLGHN
ncbi:MAG TPA: FCD domain-containing protein [Acidobacteriaceae bacterium]|jgi:DNA-binding FadR family transcriptional regulator|nr:FCD domain-containing protein [Acidobacteriaceae bacterium]